MLRTADYAPYHFDPVRAVETSQRQRSALWATLLVVVFATFVLGPYPVSLSLGGIGVQLWRVVFVGAALVALPAAFRPEQGRAPINVPFLCLALGWLGWGLLSFAWTPAFLSGLVELFGLVIGASLALTVGMIGSQSEAHQRLLTQCWTVAVGFEAAFSLVEYAIGVHLPSPMSTELARIGFGERYLTGTFANPNDVAAFLLVGLPFCIAGIKSWRTRRLRRAATGVVALAVLVVVISSSRLCTIGLGVALVTYALLRKSGGRRPYRVRLAYFGLFLLPPLLVVAQPGALAKFKNLAAEWSEGGSLRDRLLLLEHGWDAAYGSSFRGLGIGGFEPSVRDLPKQLTASGDVNPHNFAMELLSQYGLLVSVAFWAWFVHTGMKIRRWRQAEMRRDHRSFAAGLATAGMLAIAVFIPASSDPSSFIEQGTGWMLLGSILAVGPVRLRTSLSTQR